MIDGRIDRLIYLQIRLLIDTFSVVDCDMVEVGDEGVDSSDVESEGDGEGSLKPVNCKP